MFHTTYNPCITHESPLKCIDPFRHTFASHRCVGLNGAGLHKKELVHTMCCLTTLEGKNLSKWQETVSE